MLPLPTKLKHHLGNFLRFLLAYFVLECLVNVANQLGVVEHYALIEYCLAAFYFLVTGWFSWRAFTSMIRDMDFYDDYRF
jgi:hypothetical protein